MTQQKPFEIKEPHEISVTNSQGYEFYPEDKTPRYIKGGNAEIRRLRGEALLHQSEIRSFQTAASEHCAQIGKLKEGFQKQIGFTDQLDEKNIQLSEEILHLRQQLAAAPTWGEWRYLRNTGSHFAVSLHSCIDGVYEFETDDGSAALVSKMRHEDNWCYMQTPGGCSPGHLFKNYVRFRRLNYTPQQAREEPVKKEKPASDDWTPITSVEQVEALRPGFYLLKSRVGGVLQGAYSPNAWSWVNKHHGSSFNQPARDVVSIFKSYKLIHAFEEPAREVEKTYYGGMTAQELSQSKLVPNGFPEIARDLLAEQEKLVAARREIRELKGEK